MTAKELIQRLSELPPLTEITALDNDAQFCEIEDLSFIEERNRYALWLGKVVDN